MSLGAGGYTALSFSILEIGHGFAQIADALYIITVKIVRHVVSRRGLEAYDNEFIEFQK
jgi:hypothetical protein